MAKKKKSTGGRKKGNQALIDEYRKKFDALDNKRKKSTAQAVERRRQDVWEMMCEEIPQTEMASLLNVSRSTIALDVKYINETGAKRVKGMRNDPEHANSEIGMTVQKLDAVIAASFQSYATAKSGSEKAKFLDIITKTISTKIRILQETGCLPKAGIEIRAKIEREPTFAERFGDNSPLAALDNANSRHRLLGLAEKILRLAEQDANTIDVEGVVQENSSENQ